jgi:hypothetical protein
MLESPVWTLGNTDVWFNFRLNGKSPGQRETEVSLNQNEEAVFHIVHTVFQILC